MALTSTVKIINKKVLPVKNGGTFVFFGVFGLVAVKKIDFIWVFIPKLLSLHV